MRCRREVAAAEQGDEPDEDRVGNGSRGHRRFIPSVVRTQDEGT
jgi:hypothetical protein